ncbi:MAG: ABC transporter ATP-binding protein [Phycisphaeraceae bacterium]|nr:ABC transporter ATP-binding protein [Phycisphaeraceae bacterium]
MTTTAAQPGAAHARATETLIAARDVHKTYRLGRVDVPVLHGATLEVARGEWVAVLGASGSGKSTMLHLLGGLDRPDKGKGDVVFENRSLASLSRRALDRFRAREVGFVFQFYHLLPELSVLDNVLVAAMAARADLGQARARAKTLLDAFGLKDRLSHRPVELSGGERQRVAIARALVNDPKVLLADEPTGNLDRVTGDSILDAITGLRSDLNQTIVMVTHDEQVAARADRIVRLADGRVVEE